MSKLFNFYFSLTNFLPKSIWVTVGVVYFLFAVFASLHHEIEEEAIVAGSLLGVGVVGLSWWLAHWLRVSPLWLVLPIGLALLFYLAGKMNRSFWYLADVVTQPAVLVLAAVSLGAGEWLFGLVFLLVALSDLYWQKYRSFSWYPSGKPGFIFLIDFVISLLGFAVVDIINGFWIKSGVKLILAAGLMGLLIVRGGTRR